MLVREGFIDIKNGVAMSEIRYILIYLFLSVALFAQGSNITLLAHLNDYPVNGYTDVWG